MIISPPFLPAPIAGETDEAFVERAMPGGAVGDGAYPLSFDLNWHGGVHLRAPQENGRVLPVRAIADGTLAYFRPPTEKTDDPTHALNYGDGWTDNGCIVLRHETEIGEGERGQVVFYSIYMHLSKINIPHPQLQQRIYRKDSMGEAGQIYGSTGKIHFEIIADDSQIAHLTGRQQRDLDYQTHDGRTDSCWGDMYFYIPATALGYATAPTAPTQTSNQAEVTYRCPQPTGAWNSVDGFIGSEGYNALVGAKLKEGLFVRMAYDRGQCTLTTYFASGELIGTQQEDTDFEYNLYTTATRRYPGCPSAGYELLRFGRVLGPDTLQPANAAHWRKISLPERTNPPATSAWFNLNAPGVTRFSDADFPHWMGWRLIDDDQDSDSHCQSDYIRGLLEPPSYVSDPPPRQPDAATIATSAEYESMYEGDRRRLSEQYVAERELNTTRLKEPENQGKLKRLICKFPTEWSKNDFELRYGWLKRVADNGPMSEDDFKKLERHHHALAFWEEVGLGEIKNKHWHFPPKEIVLVWRKCGWFSKDELKISLQPAPTIGIQRAEELRPQMNLMLSKYLINTSKTRISHFLSQVGVETGWWQYREEIGNERYFRTMYEVITPTEAGEDYDRALTLQRNLPSGRRPIELANPGPNPQPTINKPNYINSRPGQISQKAAGMDNGVANSTHGGRVGDGARFHGRGFLQITGRRNYRGYQYIEVKTSPQTRTQTFLPLMITMHAMHPDSIGGEKKSTEVQTSERHPTFPEK
ncbi:M23 family metallopeptidase [Pseudomonas sp. DP-17]|uniref:M23 family metallopeptidase n=1 Tax=Pseudomonas sp. DP-17 TaxID=1580486 RepID=UPI001EFA54FA|nr:M23 family metallopeptidase [Pseudomonas sp. DP-17]MCG8906716.1 M23 family metallopeptidase [Pseudomonas sp. DP-17]